MYPTDVRAFFHGISAAAGKLGAIIAATVFSQVRRVKNCRRRAPVACSPPPPRRGAPIPCLCRPHAPLPLPQVSTVAIFYASAGAGVLGALMTWVFLPDTTGLDLAEIDRMHRFMLAGQV